jgi:hypothetical protein
VSASRDPLTRATRLAANAAAAAVVAFGLLWLLTTQVAAIRALSPFAYDPWDVFASYAAIFLPFVAGSTWIRSLRHRGPVLAASTARRIRWGSTVAVLIVVVAATVDLHAIVTVGWPADAGVTAGQLTALIAVALAAGLGSLALTVRATRLATRSDEANADAEAFEPDVVDDLLVLATDVARPLGLRRPARDAADAIERFLDGSTMSPRRHRWLFGVALALAAAIAFDAWHAIREGPWASPGVAVMFGILMASGVLAIYLGTLGPLRLLRPPAR